MYQVELIMSLANSVTETVLLNSVTASVTELNTEKSSCAFIFLVLLIILMHHHALLRNIFFKITKNSMTTNEIINVVDKSL